MVPRNLAPCVQDALKLVRPEEREAFGTDPLDLIQSEATCILDLIYSVIDVHDWPKFDALLERYGLTAKQVVEVPA